MKILYITTIGMTMGFFKSFIKELLDDGHIVDIATNEIESKVPECYRSWNCKVYSINCTRSPLKKGNLTAIKQIQNIVQREQYDIIHCHTPIAAACTRLACRNLRKKGVKVIYTAHGFHFYKGAPLLNWLLYYPVEKVCSYFTDVLITINKEDYEFAKKHMNAQKVEYVPGVGIDVERFKNVSLNHHEKCKEFGIPENAFLLVSVGELNKNKNHQIIIRAIKKIENESIHYLIVGAGTEEEKLRSLSVELGLENRVHLVGYRKDIPEIYKMADICCFPSIREGLGLAAIEAMASSLPLIAADNRGTREFLRDGENGFSCQFYDCENFAKAIKKLLEDSSLRILMGENGYRMAFQFSDTVVQTNMKVIYQKLIFKS